MKQFQDHSPSSQAKPSFQAMDDMKQKHLLDELCPTTRGHFSADMHNAAQANHFKGLLITLIN